MINRKIFKWMGFFCLLGANLLGAQTNLVGNPDFEKNADGWIAYSTNSSTLARSEGEAFSGKSSLKVTTYGKAVWQGAGTSVKVAPSNSYWISLRAKGEGSFVLCANGSGVWIYSPPEKLSMDKWTEFKVRRYEKGNSFTFYFNTYSATGDMQKTTYYIDDVKVEKEKQDVCPEKEIEALHYKAVDFPGNAKTVKADPPYVEGNVRYNNWLAEGLPFPETVKPVYVYLKAWLGGDKENYFSIVHSAKQRACEEKPPQTESWTWVKTGPFTRTEIGREFKVSTGGGKTVKAKLESVVISTKGNLTEKELESSKSVFAIPVKITPLLGQEKLFFEFDLAEYKNSPDQLKAELFLKSVDDKEIDKKKEISSFPGRKMEESIPFENCRPGKYEGSVRIFENGISVFSKDVSFEIPEKPAWLKERVGIEALADDCVLPPWGPVELGKGNEVRIWNREYVIGAFCLPEKIVTAESSILASPVRLRIESEGRRLFFKKQGKLQALIRKAKELFLGKEGKGPALVKQAQGAVEFSDTMKDGNISVNSRARIEYDGIILNEIELVPDKAVKIDRLTLYVPVKNEYASYLWAGGNSREKTMDAPNIIERGYSKVIKGDGVQWKNPFKEEVWIGDDDRGLLWFCTTEEFWYPQEYKERPEAQEIIREGGKTFLKIDFISRSKEINKPIKFRFGMMATPVRPMPEGWRAWRFTLRGGLWNIGLKKSYKGNMLLYWPSPLWEKYNLDPQIRDQEAYKEAAEQDHAEGRTVLPYLAPIAMGIGNYELPDDKTADKKPSASFTWRGETESMRWVDKNPAAIYAQEWESHPVKTALTKRKNIGILGHYVSQQSAYTDYVVWTMREHARCGADGIGILDGGSGLDMNRLHGAGYYDEDGILRPTYTGLAQRDMNKRLLYMFIKERGAGRKHITGLGLDHMHTGSAGKIYYNSFYDAGLKGEELNSGYYFGWKKEAWIKEYKDKREQDQYYYANMLSPEKFRIEYTGKPFGWVPVFFAQLAKSPGISKEWAKSVEGTKDYLVLTLLHDCLVYPSWSNPLPVYQTWLAKDKFGMADDDVEFLPYWKNEKYVKSSNDNVKVSLYRKKGGILVIAGNIAKTPEETRIKLNLDEISAVENPRQIFDGITDEKQGFENNSFNLKIPPRDYKIIIIKEDKK